MCNMFFRDADLFDINRVSEISYIKNVESGKSRLSIYKDHFQRLFSPLYRKTGVRKADILFFGRTMNNQRTFEPILNSINHSTYNLDNDADPLLSSYLLYSVVGVPFLILLYLRSDKEHRRIIKANKMAYLLSYGKLISTRKILKRVKPRVLVLANDHSPINRCFLWNAMRLGVKTVYTQHASVSNEFPPLAFDYSFLDGQVSFDSYGRHSKNDSLVFLSGPCRFDYMKDYIKGDRQFVGLSINEMDDFNVVKDLCLLLKTKGYSKVKVRPHPSMGQWHYDWFASNGIVFSTPANESPGEYLSTLRLQISNVSGIHLDAVMLKTPSVLYQLSVNSIADVFHFLELGVVFPADKTNIIDYINNPAEAIPSDEAVRYFVSSYQTRIDLNVGPFIAHTIDLLLDYNFDSSCVLNDLFQKYGNDILVYVF